MGPAYYRFRHNFLGPEKIETKSVVVPHPRWQERAFVALPLAELPFFQVLEKSFKIPNDFDNQAVIVSPLTSAMNQ